MVLPLGSKIKIMKSTFDQLMVAANFCMEMLINKPKRAFLIRCVGRKLIMPSSIDEGIEVISELFGSGAMLAGFYSYREISPLNPMEDCELQNQTMTITGINEIV